MATEKELVQSGYENLIKTIYANFYDRYIMAENANEKTSAERQFTDNVANAKAIRDRALTLLP